MSWKKQENYLFEDEEAITFCGTIQNHILFPIRLTISFAVINNEQVEPLARPSFHLYIEPNSLHKFESQIRIKGESEEVWNIEQVELSVWNFKTFVNLPHPIKLQIYQKQPCVDLLIKDEIHCEESSNILIETTLAINSQQIPLCLIKLSCSVYYTLDVGFQET